MYEYWLAALRGVRSEKKKMLRQFYGDAKELYRAAIHIEETKPPYDRLTKKEREALKRARKEMDPERMYEALLKKEIRFVPWFDPDYPSRLKDISPPPYALYVLGELPEEEEPAAAIVGARQCTPYGESMAVAYGEAFARIGVPVVSGMAYGVDGAAHRGCLCANGKTYAVLGGGVDVCYPKEHLGLYRELKERGGLLSEQPPGTKPLAQNFPARNRIISGLADVVLVMEARERSGSLITADMALEEGKEVYALPGPVTNPLSQGCHHLIRQGAGILVSPDELMEELSLQSVWRKKLTKCPAEKEKEKPPKYDQKRDQNKKILETNNKLVYSFLGLRPKGIQELTQETGLSVAEVMSELVTLQLEGKALEISKNYYCLT